MPFNFGRFGRKNRQPVSKPYVYTPDGLAPPYDYPGAGAQSHAPVHPEPVKGLVQEETSMRFMLTAFASFCLFLSLIFLIMVEIGNTANKVALRDMWFFKVQFTDIHLISNSTPGLGYELAESLGLYDFYQVGLWNYCEGNNSTGLAQCQTPETMYWFNPLDILTDQLNGSVHLPQAYNRDVHVIKVCSNWMFGLFLTGAVLSFVLTPVVLLGMRSRWYSTGLSIITFINAICVLAATIIATALFCVLRRVFRDYVEIINLVPTLGTTMFAMMWLASLFAICAFGIQAALSCCFTSQRDLRRARQKSFI